MSPRSKASLLLAASLMLAACGGPAKGPRTGDAKTPLKGPAPSDVVVDPALLTVATDPCGARLHDMCEPLLLYYAAVHRLPNTLRELAAFADQELVFTCPVSGEEYIYRPVPIVGNQAQLIMYDRSAVHGHMRWGVIAMPAHDRHPLEFNVIPMNDQILRRYLPEANVSPAPPAPAGAAPGAAPAPADTTLPAQ